MKKVLLHAACGPATIQELGWLQGADGPMFDPESWTELRLDIDSQYGADIVGDMRDVESWTWSLAVAESWMSGEAHPSLDKTIFLADAIFCSHALEHLHLSDAPRALGTFRSVLKPDGLLVLVVPNFQAACRHVVEGQGAKLYDSPAGPIFGHEVIYGKENWTADNVYQRHLTGYTPDLFRGVLAGAGFKLSFFSADPINLIAIATP